MSVEAVSTQNNITTYMAIGLGSIVALIFIALFITDSLRRRYDNVSVIEQQEKAMQEWGM
jgi:hypothetical protein